MTVTLPERIAERLFEMIEADNRRPLVKDRVVQMVAEVMGSAERERSLEIDVASLAAAKAEQARWPHGEYRRITERIPILKSDGEHYRVTGHHEIRDIPLDNNGEPMWKSAPWSYEVPVGETVRFDGYELHCKGGPPQYGVFAEELREYNTDAVIMKRVG